MVPEGDTAVRVASREDLEARYGHILQSMADEYPTAYKLCGAFKKLSPPVLLTDGIAKEWFKRNRGALKYISRAGELEVHCGGRIPKGGRQRA